MKSGPDVFADALVPKGVFIPGTHRSRNAIFLETHRFDGRASRHLAHNPSNSVLQSTIKAPRRGLVPVFGASERRQAVRPVSRGSLRATPGSV
jgi:hypothetical protein